MDADEHEALTALGDRSLSENDREAWIDILEVYLCVEALDALTAICQDSSESAQIRNRAAQAIRAIRGTG